MKMEIFHLRNLQNFIKSIFTRKNDSKANAYTNNFSILALALFIVSLITFQHKLLLIFLLLPNIKTLFTVSVALSS